MPGLRRVSGRATWLLGQASTRAHRLLSQALGTEGVRGYHFRLLAALEEHGPSSQAELGRRAQIDPSDVTATLEDLLTAGLAARSPDPADGRRNLVSMTPAGQTALERWDRLLGDVHERVLEPLTERERSTLLDLLTKLTD